MAESTTVTIIQDPASFQLKALYWANRFKVVCLLDNNNYTGNANSYSYHSHNWLLAIDALDELMAEENAFAQLKSFHEKTRSPIFGFLSYDLKNQVEELSSKHPDELQFPLLYFFKPRYVLEFNGNKLTVNRNYPETFELIDAIEKTPLPGTLEQPPFKLLQRTPKEKYLQNVGYIKKQIEEGDYYELNYCNEFYAENASINPINTFNILNESARAPFGAFFKHNGRHLLCASPERFLRKEGSKLISQPIKGTIKKGATVEENEQLQKQLQNDVKERAENVMIVDLVRNDLAKSAIAGSVKVEELFGVYSFNTVNQMISTITAELKRRT